MDNIKKILVPLDFSENSRFAFDWAMSIADKLGTKVVLFHACEIPARFKEATGKDRSLYNDVLMGFKKKARQDLQAFADKYDDDQTTIALEIAEGKPFIEIIKAAKNYDVDLIVMGTHGHTGLQHMLIGSVAEKVVRKAPCPVLTVKHPDYEFEMP